MKSAQSQLSACRRKHLQTIDGCDEQNIKFILTRSQDIYRQSVLLYNQALHQPQNLIPGFLMGFQSMKEDRKS
ncbi:hypothetical protein [Anaerotignum sp.]|uniref:hypothetical protein n=1 Tax=Anaerotignum sp. TaxID=2039241 RepID=UPI00331FDC92